MTTHYLLSHKLFRFSSQSQNTPLQVISHIKRINGVISSVHICLAGLCCHACSSLRKGNYSNEYMVLPKKITITNKETSSYKITVNTY